MTQNKATEMEKYIAHSKEAVTLKIYSREQGVPLWKVAEAVGVSEFSFSRAMRHLTAEKRKEYEEIIDGIKEGEKND